MKVSTFVGRLELQPLMNAIALTLHCTATRASGKHMLKETILLAAASDGT